MFGGSPICVAVPPMLLNTTSGSRKGIGLIFMMPHSSIVTGAISNMVVTLSRKAEQRAVSMHSAKFSASAFPRDRMNMRMAMNSKKPVVDSIWIMIIMPNRRHSVDESIQPTTVDRSGASNTSAYSSSATNAPMKATMARLITSSSSSVYTSTSSSAPSSTRCWPSGRSASGCITKLSARDVLLLT